YSFLNSSRFVAACRSEHKRIAFMFSKSVPSVFIRSDLLPFTFGNSGDFGNSGNPVVAICLWLQPTTLPPPRVYPIPPDSHPMSPDFTPACNVNPSLISPHPALLRLRESAEGHSPKNTKRNGISVARGSGIPKYKIQNTISNFLRHS